MLGVCYYPEHWPESIWQQDAEQMKELGLQYVRIGEFCWSRIEPEDGHFEFAWLDKSIEILAAQGLKVIFGTPTATPPKWLIDKYDDILPVDVNTGVTRGFGSRRHYDYSSENYLREALRISEVLVKRYGNNPAVVGWQTDNELSCHDTTLSASPAALNAFHAWCEKRYKTIESLNTAWGNVFWSMEYNNFQQIEVPFMAVTETNPAHRLAYQRFSSDQVIRFHRLTIELIRKHASGKFITHNFIPMDDTDVDNFALAEGLDFVSFDNYPLGRSDLFFSGDDRHKIANYERTGHPDYSSYFFDQVRGLSEGDFWIMEQQPGPVNWAQNNPRPENGMVRLWSLVAFAHGAECVCYFRWRQIPFAQEQMHAGVLRNDSSKARAWFEAQEVFEDLKKLDFSSPALPANRVAILTDADGRWISRIEQQGVAYDFEKVEFAYYTALRQLGINVDFVSQDSDFSQYDLIIAPCLPVVSDEFIAACKNSKAKWVFGPRSGSKTKDFNLPENLAPGKLQELIPTKVLSVETTHKDLQEVMHFAGKEYSSWGWREELDVSRCKVVATYKDASAAIVEHKNIHYVGCLVSDDFLLDYFENICNDLGIDTLRTHKDIRISQRGQYTFAFNYGSEAKFLENVSAKKFVIGSAEIKGFGVSVWLS